jgi:integrase
MCHKVTKAGKTRHYFKITETIYAMLKTNAIERRNRALIAVTLLFGARDGAIISMNVGHVDLESKEFH